MGADPAVTALPAGFEIESSPAAPDARSSLPAGFELEAPTAAPLAPAPPPVDALTGLPLPHDAAAHADAHAQFVMDRLEDVGRQMEQNAVPPALQSPAPAIGPSPHPWLDRLREAVSGPDTALGSIDGDKTTKPLVNLQDLMPPANGPVSSVAHGVAEGVSGFTTPANLATIPLFGSVGQLGGPVLSRLVAGGFSVQALKSLWDTVPQFKQAVASGNSDAAWQIAGRAVADAGIAALTTRDAIHGPGVSPLSEENTIAAGSRGDADTSPVKNPGMFQRGGRFNPATPEVVNEPAPPPPSGFELEAPTVDLAPDQFERTTKPAPGKVGPYRPEGTGEVPPNLERIPNRNAARPKQAPIVPEEGTPEDEARGLAAREDLAQQLTGKSFGELSNPDRLAIDDLIAKGFQGEPQAHPSPGMPEPEPETPEAVHARLLNEWLARNEADQQNQQSYADFLKQRFQEQGLIPEEGPGATQSPASNEVEKGAVPNDDRNAVPLGRSGVGTSRENEQDEQVSQSESSSNQAAEGSAQRAAQPGNAAEPGTEEKAAGPVAVERPAGVTQSGGGEGQAQEGLKLPVRAETSRQIQAPELSGNRDEKYPLDASDKFHAIKARFEPIPLPSEDEPHAIAHVANLSGIEYLGRNTGFGPDQAALAVNGIHIAPDQLDALIHNIGVDEAGFQKAPAALTQLREMAEQARAEGKSLVFVKDHALLPEGQRAAALDEELNHALQRAKTGPLTNHLGGKAQAFIDSPLGAKAKRALERGNEYEFRSPGHAAAEIGERLMRPGAYRELGLNPEEARALGAQYVQSLKEAHGHAATDPIARRVSGAVGEPGRTDEAARAPSQEREADRRGGSGLRSQPAEGRSENGESVAPEVSRERAAPQQQGPVATSFETADGQRYSTEGRRTQRFTAKGESFAPSATTVYVAPETAQWLRERLGDYAAHPALRASVGDLGNGVGLVVKDRTTGQVRNDLSRTIPYSSEPQAGLHPVEISKNPKTGESASRIGGPITRVDRSEAPPAKSGTATAPPEKPASATSGRVREALSGSGPTPPKTGASSVAKKTEAGKTTPAKAGNAPNPRELTSMLGGSRNPVKGTTKAAASTLKDAAATVSESADDIRKVFAPASRSVSGQRAANILRGNIADTVRRYDQAQAALDTARKYFQSQKPEDNYSFIDRVESGAKQKTPEEQQIADTFRSMLDDRRKQVQELGKGKLEDFYENYFPHVWQDPDKATNVFARMLGRRPLEGGKSFLKQRTHITFADGLEAGLKPVSDNPVDLVLLKTREMDRYIMAHRTLNQYAEQGLAQQIPVGRKAPDGWLKVADPIGTVYGAPTVEFPHFYDAGMREMLGNLADSLGIKIQRNTRIKGYPRAAGLSHTGGDLVEQATASNEDVLAHEIGHQLEDRFHLTDRVLARAQNPAEQRELKNEMRAIADLRMEGRENQTSAAFKSYIHSKPEQAAAMVQAFAYMPDRMEEVAPHVFTHLMDVLHEDPALEPLLAVRPSLQLGKEMGEVAHGGLLIRGNWYMPEGAAQVLNNYLSPGLRQKGWYKALLGANNVLNQAQLGVSAFHLGFTSLDATTSRASLGFEQLLRGRPIQAVKSFAETPFAALTTAFKGNKLLKEWYRPGAEGGEIAQLADELTRAGGRARMDSFYATDAAKNMVQAWRAGNPIGAALRLPVAALEKMAAPLMEYLVPRQKLGVWLDMARFEMAEHARRMQQGIAGPDSLETMRRNLRDAWDSVDNRMGQMTYDNLFWNRTAKDLAMLNVRSVGWNLGTLREIGGGVTDLVRQPLNKFQGKPVNLKRISYLMGLVGVTAISNAVYQYLRTGQGPQELKDYWFPKTGELDENGRPQRVSLPTYAKDVYDYATNPGRTLANKVSPLDSTVAEMIRNKDFYGDKIRNEDDPLVKQLWAEAKFAGQQVEPFGVRNFVKQGEAGESALTRAQNFIGITPAPRSVEQTKAERLASNLAQRNMPAEGRTQEQAERSQVERKIASGIRRGQDERADALQALKAGTITPRELVETLKTAKLSPLERSVQHLPVGDVLKVFEAATPEERQTLKPILARRLMSASKTLPEEQFAPLLAKVKAVWAK